MLASIQKDVLSTLWKSGSFYVTTRRTIIGGFMHTHTQTPTASEVQGSPACTLPLSRAVCHQPTLQWFYKEPGCSCCQVVLSTPPVVQLNTKCCYSVLPWVTGAQTLQSLWISKMTLSFICTRGHLSSWCEAGAMDSRLSIHHHQQYT